MLGHAAVPLRDVNTFPGCVQPQAGDGLSAKLAPERVIGDLRSLLRILEHLIERIGSRQPGDADRTSRCSRHDGQRTVDPGRDVDIIDAGNESDVPDDGIQQQRRDVIMDIATLSSDRRPIDGPSQAGSGSSGATAFDSIMQAGSIAPQQTAGTSSGEPNQASASGSGQNKTQQINGDLQDAMSQTQANDPTLFAKTMKDGQTGDGNALVQDELQAYKSGDITKQQATEEISGAQALANAHGGGKISKQVISQETAALGTNVIHGGKTRGEQKLVTGLEDFTGLGAVIKGIGQTTSKGDKPEDILAAAQPATQQGTQQALEDMQQADPALAQKFQQDAGSGSGKGDGNAMTADLVQLKNEETDGQVPDTFTDADAQTLGYQIGGQSKGKVSSAEDQDFAAAFGTDTLDRGSGKGTKILDKVENGVGNAMQQIVSPETDSVGAVDQFAHGNTKGGLDDLGQAAIGAASDAAMVAAPEAAPEIEMGGAAAGAAARAGMDGAGDAAKSGSSLGSSLGKANDYGNDINNAYSQMSGNNQNNGVPA